MDENILMLCYTTYKYKIYITKQVNKNAIKNYKKETYQANKQTSKSVRSEADRAKISINPFRSEEAKAKREPRSLGTRIPARIFANLPLNIRTFISTRY